MKTLIATAALTAAALLTTAAQATQYKVDPAHSSVTFKIQHAGISWVHGRFDKLEGRFAIDEQNPARSQFGLVIAADSINTGVEQRDGHLKSGDFFDVERFPQISFRSTAVTPVDGGLKLTGDLSLHGVTKNVTFVLEGGQQVEFPEGVQRIGYFTAVKVKRSAFGMKTMLGPVGDEVEIEIALEATKE